MPTLPGAEFHLGYICYTGPAGGGGHHCTFEFLPPLKKIPTPTCLFSSQKTMKLKSDQLELDPSSVWDYLCDLGQVTNLSEPVSPNSNSKADETHLPGPSTRSEIQQVPSSPLPHRYPHHVLQAPHLNGFPPSSTSPHGHPQ